ncbi:hypothetical protein J2793_006916 [Paraburkholderia caledonica]|uniref:Uncharacterized protein n=2 Tax=Paraburkholderia caledonica TaxID=134536 RepID=A0AB73IN51_9BURK|nr:hypothetical protein [Paraburkholderia caledonica]
MIAWYRAGLEVSCELPKLAAYLGHVNVDLSYWYICNFSTLLRVRGIAAASGHKVVAPRYLILDNDKTERSTQTAPAFAPPQCGLLESTSPPLPRFAMQYRVAYEHSLRSAPDDFIVHVPSQLLDDIPANIPRALLPEYITDIILKRSSQIAKIRNLRGL